MSDFRDLEEQLAGLVPATPRPELESEILGSVGRELRVFPWGRFAVAAVLLVAAVIGIRVQELGHRIRVAGILAERSNPRVERAVEELSPWLTSKQLEARLRWQSQRSSDRRWARYLTARFKAGEDHG